MVIKNNNFLIVKKEIEGHDTKCQLTVYIFSK